MSAVLATAIALLLSGCITQAQGAHPETGLAVAGLSVTPTVAGVSTPTPSPTAASASLPTVTPQATPSPTPTPAASAQAAPAAASPPRPFDRHSWLREAETRLGKHFSKAVLFQSAFRSPEREHWESNEIADAEGNRFAFELRRRASYAEPWTGEVYDNSKTVGGRQVGFHYFNPFGEGAAEPAQTRDFWPYTHVLAYGCETPADTYVVIVKRTAVPPEDSPLKGEQLMERLLFECT